MLSKFAVFLIVFIGVFSNLYAMERQTPQSRLNELYVLMHDKMLGIQQVIPEKYFEIFKNETYPDLDGLSVYGRIKKLIKNSDDIILQEITGSELLINDIERSHSDDEYARVFRPRVRDHLDSLNLITGIFINMAILPVCAYIEWVKGFDQVKDLLDTPRFKSDEYGSVIKKLMDSMKAIEARISDVIDRLLKAAISKEKDVEERKRLEEEQARRRRDEQERREEEARALAGAEAERRNAELARQEAEERVRSAENAARKAREEADRAEQAEKKRLQEAARVAEEAAQKAEEAKQKAELEEQRRKRLQEEADRMDKEALKQVKKGVNGLPDVKALLEKIKKDVEDKNFSALQNDISNVDLEFKGKKFPGLLKSLNEYLSNGTVGLFVQMFELIEGVLQKPEIKKNQKSTIFNVLKTKIMGVSEFHQLVNKSGIIGSQQKGIYKKGAVEFENLIKLIDAYRAMCLATQIEGIRTEETIKQEFFGRDLLDGTIRTVKRRIDEEKSKEVVPELPPREGPLKKSLTKLKKSIQELKNKTETLQDKLEALAQILGE